MSTDPTEAQGTPDRRRSQQMSLKRGHPPTQVPGYEAERCLGVGAYGEVWVAVERNTGRRVAIKFYAHRGGLDWSLLHREVEKLAFLFADRYVVQLLGVGWDAEPPYYIMEYLEQGSLADRLQQGPLPVDEALATFHDVAVGLLHAHGKGVLHCDLKPANILLDQDSRPRLADFGQSRLSHEQAPALGTLFYMAPEQADLEAVPDARWDVYALGALLYCMLTGSPPYRTGETVDAFERSPDLSDRLARYRRMIEESPPPAGHRQMPGVDRALAEIVERCLAPDPNKRYPNVQAVLHALNLRAARRARRPLVVLGAVGPALLLAIVSWFAWRGFDAAMEESEAALIQRALQSNRLTAQYVARTAAHELERRWNAVRQVAASKTLQQAVAEAFQKPELQKLSMALSDPDLAEDQREQLRKQFLEQPGRQAFQQTLASLVPPNMKAPDHVASWFFCDSRGVTCARVPESRTVGRNFAWRTFFHGGAEDREETWRPEPGAAPRGKNLSSIFRSQSSTRWIVAVSAPVFDGAAGNKFLGVVALTVEVGRLVSLPGRDQQFPVLVDWRPGKNKGVILEHPLFNKLLARGKLPDRFKNYRVAEDDLPDTPERRENYSDPLADDEEGAEYDGRWLAWTEPIRNGDDDTGWVVLVQEDYDTAIGAPMDHLRNVLVRYGLLALLLVAVLMIGLWALATRLSGIRSAEIPNP